MHDRMAGATAVGPTSGSGAAPRPPDPIGWLGWPGKPSALIPARILRSRSGRLAPGTHDWTLGCEPERTEDWRPFIVPPMLFGWEDLRGDHTPEILRTSR